MKKFLIMTFLMLCSIIPAAAQYTFSAKPGKGIYLIDAQNVHLEDGNCIATEGKVHEGKYAGKLYVYISTTGWSIDADWSNVQLIMTENGIEKEIDIRSLGTDTSAYNFFTIETDGNTSYIKFSYIFFINSWDDIYDLRWELKVQKNGNWHHCIIGVSKGEIITEVEDVKIEDNDIYYNLSGHSSNVPFKGINIYKGKKIIK